MLLPSANMVQEQMPEFQPEKKGPIRNFSNTHGVSGVLRFSGVLTRSRPNMDFQVEILGVFVLDVEIDVIQSFEQWNCGPPLRFSTLANSLLLRFFRGRQKAGLRSQLNDFFLFWSDSPKKIQQIGESSTSLRFSRGSRWLFLSARRAGAHRTTRLESDKAHTWDFFQKKTSRWLGVLRIWFFFVGCLVWVGLVWVSLVGLVWLLGWFRWGLLWAGLL